MNSYFVSPEDISKGVRGSSYGCMIARALHRAGVADVAVMHYAIRIYAQKPTKDFPNSAALSSILRIWDQGRSLPDQYTGGFIVELGEAANVRPAYVWEPIVQEHYARLSQ